MATTPDYLTIDEGVLEKLLVEIFGKVNERIASRIVNSISEDSDANHVPSALAVFNFLRAFTPNLKIQTVTGNMSTVKNPAADTIYLQRDSASDPTWVMYIWVNDDWISIGDTSIDLENYWSRSKASVDELREQILDPTGINLIKDGIDWDALFKDTTESMKALVAQLDDVYIRKDSVANFTDAQLKAAVNWAFNQTDPNI